LDELDLKSWGKRHVKPKYQYLKPKAEKRSWQDLKGSAGGDVWKRIKNQKKGGQDVMQTVGRIEGRMGWTQYPRMKASNERGKEAKNVSKKG